jgi:DNA-binding MarR family transcriptional regulator
MNADSPAADPTAPADREQVAVRLRLAIGRLSRRVNRRAVGGLTPSQLSALFIIEQAGPLRVTELAVREDVAPPSMTRIVASLEQIQLVSRTPDPADGRAALLVISEAGRETLQQIRRVGTTFLTARLALVDDASLAVLAQALPILERLVADLPPV